MGARDTLVTRVICGEIFMQDSTILPSFEGNMNGWKHDEGCVTVLGSKYAQTRPYSEARRILGAVASSVEC